MKIFRYLFFFVLSLLGCLGSQAADNNRLVVPTQYGSPNRQMVLEVSMDNADVIYGYQFDIKLPQGITIVKDADDDYVADGGTRGKNHTITIKQFSNNVYRVTAINFGGKTFEEKEGSVCRLTLKVAPSVMTTAYPLSLTNIEMTAKGNKVNHPANANFKLVITPIGDANGDLDVNIADVVTIVASITGKNPSPFNKSAADIDGGGPVNEADIKSLVAILLK